MVFGAKGRFSQLNPSSFRQTRASVGKEMLYSSFFLASAYKKHKILYFKHLRGVWFDGSQLTLSQHLPPSSASELSLNRDVSLNKKKI